MQAKDIEKLVIYREDLKAGILQRTSTGCIFHFDPEFLSSPRFQWLTLRIKKSHQPISITGSNLHPFFAGLLPEGRRLNTLQKILKTSADDMFSLFAAAGNNVIGDVHCQTGNKTENAYRVPPLKKIDFYEYFNDLLSCNSYQLGEDSIAGVQEKISASMISFPLNIARARNAYILKLNPEDKPDLVQNELYCMELAGKCGLHVAKTKLVRDRSGNLGLLVQRFDRDYDETLNKSVMHHQEDACQFLDKYPSEKYRISLNDIAAGICDLSSASSVMLLKLLHLYCFSYLLGNGDLHAKNISLMVKHGSRLVELTPAYDLICTLIYGDHQMALKIDGRNDNIKRATILDFAERFNLSGPAAQNMLDKLLKSFSSHCAILEKIPMTARQRTLLQKTIEKRLADLS
ncbi:MAG: hypothetical protein CVV41_19955 [Candidatus Riflebacteria bacterium HGW-Riflebacteria-1]|jgi:serine/threonine-protein kinase HipA|nr:MAG: hypothetical protein CVV41_19955 [Candidatus Riflebacteria bacterium HGW-Riflebacteria-1]